MIREAIFTKRMNVEFNGESRAGPEQQNIPGVFVGECASRLGDDGQLYKRCSSDPLAAKEKHNLSFIISVVQGKQL